MRVALLIVAGVALLAACRNESAHYLYPREAVVIPPPSSPETWPRTVEDAAERIVSAMSEESKAAIRSTPKVDLVDYHHGWGTGIRNEFGLWRGNTTLIADCHAEHPDDASMVIIEAVWQRLQKP